MKRKIILSFIGLIVIIAGIVVCTKSCNKKPLFDTAKIERRDIVKTVEASGTINPVQTVNIGSQVSGMISDIYVDYNSEVKKGQLLAKIDPSLFQAQVDKATSDLQNAKANYQKVKSNYIYQKANYERYARLYKNRYVSKSETELAYADYKSKEAELAASKALIDQAAATLENNLTNLKYTRIVSPVDGVVIARKVDVGQTVAASFQTPELFTVAQDLTQMQIEVSVSEADIGDIKVGQKADYTLDGYPDRMFSGTVQQVRINPTTVSNVTTYTVIVKVENEENILKPGMSANVTITTTERKDVLCVPNNAFKYIPEGLTERYDKVGVWVLDKKKKQNRIEVETGIKDSEYTEILSGNLSEGDTVIIPLGTKKKNNMPKPPGMF